MSASGARTAMLATRGGPMGAGGEAASAVAGETAARAAAAVRATVGEAMGALREELLGEMRQVCPAHARPHRARAPACHPPRPLRAHISFCSHSSPLAPSRSPGASALARLLSPSLAFSLLSSLAFSLRLAE